MVQGLHALTSRSAWRRISLRWVPLARTRPRARARKRRRAIDAARTVSDGLAAAEADAAQRFIEFTRVAAGKFGKTFRSTLPGTQGLGLVTKNLGKRNGALTRPASSKVTNVFMRLVNAVEKSLEPQFRQKDNCPEIGRSGSVERGALDLESGGSSRATTSSIALASLASHSTSITVSLAGSRVKIRLWLISMMLTPASWTLAVIAASAPG